MSKNEVRAFLDITQSIRLKTKRGFEAVANELDKIRESIQGLDTDDASAIDKVKSDLKFLSSTYEKDYQELNGKIEELKEELEYSRKLLDKVVDFVEKEINAVPEAAPKKKTPRKKKAVAKAKK